MKRVLLVFLLCIVGLGASAEDDDSLGIIRRTVRGFDRLDNAYIEPQHYEFTVMAQLTRTYENFAIASNNQSITLAPDGLTKIGPYFGWRWFFLGYTFDIKNIGFSQNVLSDAAATGIYTSQVGIDIFATCVWGVASMVRCSRVCLSMVLTWASRVPAPITSSITVSSLTPQHSVRALVRRLAAVRGWRV